MNRIFTELRCHKRTAFNLFMAFLHEFSNKIVSPGVQAETLTCTADLDLVTWIIQPVCTAMSNVSKTLHSLNLEFNRNLDRTL